MDDPITFESIDVSMSVNLKDTRAKPKPDTPFKILILGDFSGRANRGLETDGSDIQERRLYRVDRDNDEEVMERLGVSVSLRATGKASPPVDLSISEMDDFHPEQIFYQASIFKTLKNTRKKLTDPDTFAETAALLSPVASQADGREKTSGTQDKPMRELKATQETPAGLLDQIIDAGAPSSRDSGMPQPQTKWDQFIGDVVAPYLVPNIEQEQDTLVKGVDQSIAGLMKAILHHPDFQAVESTWRALRFVIRRLETGENLQVYLLDLTKAELTADLTGSEDLQDASLFKKLASAAQASAGQAPWALLAGIFTFDKTRGDAVTLARAGAMGQMLGAPFIAAAGGSVIGCRSIAETPDPSDWTVGAASEDEMAWQVVRTLPEANWVGLALPRWLVRLPYGQDIDPVDVFDFEEMPPEPVHGNYLWANPAFAAVLVLGRTFTRAGWDFTSGLTNDITGLPLHTFNHKGETVIKPCAEVCLSEWAMAKTADRGIMPLMAFKDQDRIMISRLQSIASPPAVLAGRWW